MTTPRRRGHPAPVRDQQRKLRLVLERIRTPTGELRFPTHAALAKALGLHPADLSKVMNGAPLSSTRIPALLRLFDLDVDDNVAELEGEAVAQAWMDLACEPFDAFRARVRLAGGDDHCGEAGGTWDDFMRRLRGGGAASPANRAFTLTARDEGDWLRPPPLDANRMGPRRHQSGDNRAPHEPLIVHAGHLARVFLDAQAALPRRPVSRRGAHVFIFQDVLVGKQRRIAALVPYPDGRGLEMPSGHIVSGSEPVLQVPTPRGREQFLEIYPDWGSRRSLVAVVTDRPLDAEIIDESRRHDMMQIERVDLLAARLEDRDRWPDGSWTVWELPYQVVAG